MDNHRIHELLARKLAGEATHLEIIEFNELMAKHPDSIYYDEILGQLWMESTSKGNMHEIDIVYHRHQEKYKNEFVHDIIRPLLAFNKKTIRISLISTLLIILIAGLFVSNTKKTSVSDIQIVAGKGMRKKINLPDGTIVWLNSDSRLTYSASINEDKKRVVFLTGEAYFDVAHQQKRPFFVRTNKISIKVLGTKFNVKAYEADQKSEATLINGSIELSLNERPQQKIKLNPSEKFALVQKKHTGKKLKVMPNDITLMIENVNPVQIGNQVYIEETSWKDSKLVFSNETLEEIRPKLERWYNVKIHIKSQKTISYRFTGVLKSESIEEALTAMQLIKPFNFKLTDYDVIIY